MPPAAKGVAPLESLMEGRELKGNGVAVTVVPVKRSCSFPGPQSKELKTNAQNPL